MRNIELASLAIAIEYPDFVYLLFDNADENLWIGTDAKLMFRIMDQTRGEGNTFTWPLMFDLFRGAGVKQQAVDDMISCLAGIPAGLAEKVLQEYLEKLKINRARGHALREIQKQIQGPVFDLETIKKIIADAEMQSVKNEDHALRVAYDEYLSWITAENSGIMTGFPSLDHLTDALNFGELVTIMGRTRVGKSWIGINIFINIARQHKGLSAAFFSMEMPKAAIAERMMQIEFDKSRWELKPNVRLDPDGFRDIFTIHYPRASIYGGIYGADDIAVLTKKHGHKVAIIDFLGLMRSPNQSDSLYQQISQKIMKLKQIAKETGTLIILLVQLSRAAGNGDLPVTIDMCRDSGVVEELSDFIYGIWAPELNPDLSGAERTKWQGRLALALLKNKRGASRMIICRFDKRTGRIIEEADDANMG